MALLREIKTYVIFQCSETKRDAQFIQIIKN
jgi:hypothetical protein